MKFFGYFFFFMMMVIPTTFQGPRGGLLILMLLVALMCAFRDGLHLHPWIVGLTALCVLTSLIFMTWGAINNAPGALRVGTVYVLWPLLFVFLMGVFSEPKFWEPYYRVIVLASITIELMFILVVTDAIGMTNTGIVGLIGAQVGIFEGMTQLHMQSMGTLIFSIPFLIARMISPIFNESDSRVWKTIEIIALLGGLVVTVMSGRKALMLVIMLAPFIAVILLILSRERVQLRQISKIVAIGILGLFFVNLIHNIDFSVLADFFISGFDFNDIGTTVNRRKEQFDALISGWMLNPMFGAGLGAAASDNIGLQEQAWAYELQYVALLFHVGIVGTLVYVGAISWLYFKSIRLMRRNSDFRVCMVPLITGLTSFLIANATNPYLGKFDFLWVLFLPIAVLNSFLIQKKSVFPAESVSSV